MFTDENLISDKDLLEQKVKKILCLIYEGNQIISPRRFTKPV